MKRGDSLRVFNRVLLFLYALAIAVASASLLAAHYSGATQWLPSAVESVWPVALMVAALLLIASIWLIISTFQRSGQSSEMDGIVYDGPDGPVILTYQALETLVLRAAREVPGLRDIETHLHLSNETQSLSVRLRVVVRPNVNLPDISAQLQRRVKEYIEQTAGVKVAEVGVVLRAAPLLTPAQGR